MLKKTIIIISFLTVTACSSGGGGGGGGSLPSSIVGVWDVSTTYGQATDEYYTVIRSDGTGTDYDYMGDSYDQGQNCYLVSNYNIRSLGSGSYEVDYGNDDVEVFDITIENNVMTYTIANFGTFTAPRSNFQESDFSPIC